MTRQNAAIRPAIWGAADRVVEDGNCAHRRDDVAGQRSECDHRDDRPQLQASRGGVEKALTIATSADSVHGLTSSMTWGQRGVNEVLDRDVGDAERAARGRAQDDALAQMQRLEPTRDDDRCPR